MYISSTVIFVIDSGKQNYKDLIVSKIINKMNLNLLTLKICKTLIISYLKKIQNV